MIQAGTISTGSANTVSVVGLYWISSISSLRNTTSPGVMATSSPTVKRRRGAWAHRQHGAQRVLLKIEQPAPEIGAAFAQGVLDDHGLSQGTLDGETASSACRPHEGDARGAFRRHAADGPRRVSPPFLLRQKGLLPEDEGEAVPSLVLEAPVSRGRGERFLVGGALGGGVQREAAKPSSGLQRKQRQLHLPAGRAGQMRGPFEPGGELGMRGNALSEARQCRPRQPVDRLEGGAFGRWRSILARLEGRRIARRYRRGGVERRALIHRLKGVVESEAARLAPCQMGSAKPLAMLPNRNEALVMALPQIAANATAYGCSRPGCGLYRPSDRRIGKPNRQGAPRLLG